MIQPRPDDILEIDCRGTRIRTTRRVIAKGKKSPIEEDFVFYRLFDPKCAEYLAPERDGSVKIDAHPTYIQCLIAGLDCDSEESRDRNWIEFEDKYDSKMANHWWYEFLEKYDK